MTQEQKERTPDDISSDILDHIGQEHGFIFPTETCKCFSLIRDTIQSERLLREKVDGENAELKRIIGNGVVLEITKLKSELAHELDMGMQMEHSIGTLKEENLSLSLQVNKLQDFLKRILEKTYPHHIGGDKEIHDLAREGLKVSSPKDIGKVVREVSLAFERRIPNKDRGPWTHADGCPAEDEGEDKVNCSCGTWDEIDKDKALLTKLREIL